MPTSNGVGDDGCVGMAEMWFSIDIIDGCRGAELGDFIGRHLYNLEPDGGVIGVSFIITLPRIV